MAVDILVVTVDRTVATGVSPDEDLSSELTEADEDNNRRLIFLPEGSNQPVPIEISPDLTNATASADGSDGYSGSVDTDDSDGTLYHVVTDSSTSPTATEVKSGNNEQGGAAAASGSQAISSTGTKSVGQTGVLSDGTYYIHYMHEDTNVNQSEVTSSGSFAVDTTAPSLTSATASADGADGYSGSVDTDEGDGTLYHVVDTSSTAPTATQVKNGNGQDGSAADASGSQAISSTGTKNVGQTGVLSGGTTYYIHYMHEDSNGNQSSVASSGSFTTVSNLSSVSDLNAVPGDSETTLDWTNGSNVSEVEVHRDTTRFTPTAGDSNTLVTTITSPNAGGSESYTDDGTGSLSAPSNGTNYFYNLIVKDGGGSTEGSNEVFSLPDTTLPEVWWWSDSEDVFVKGKGTHRNELLRSSGAIDDLNIRRVGYDGAGNLLALVQNDIWEIDPTTGDRISRNIGPSIDWGRLFAGAAYVYDGTDVVKYSLPLDGSSDQTFPISYTPDKNSQGFDGHSADDLYFKNGSGGIEKRDSTNTVQWTYTPSNGRGVRYVVADPTGGVWFTNTGGSSPVEYTIHKIDAAGNLVGTSVLTYTGASSIEDRDWGVTKNNTLALSISPDISDDRLVVVDGTPSVLTDAVVTRFLNNANTFSQPFAAGQDYLIAIDEDNDDIIQVDLSNGDIIVRDSGEEPQGLKELH